MEESKGNPSSAHGKIVLNPFAKKPKKRSLVERELETNLTARITSPVTAEGASTSRYGRARRLKTKNDNDGVFVTTLKLPRSENTPVKVQSPNIKANYPLKTERETPKKALTTTLDNIDNIYHENKSLSRFTKDEIQRNSNNSSLAKTFPKSYTRKDLIQNRDDDDDDGIVLIKDLFSSPKPGTKSLVHSSTKKYTNNQNSLIDNKSVVKMLDFDSSKQKKENKDVKTSVKNEVFHVEANSPYQVGDLAWARMGTFPFWPCIITRDPATDMFVRKKLFGRVEHFILHVTFFADNGRRSWVVDNMLRKYMGSEEFMCTRQKFTTEDKKKDPRLYAAFFISEKKQSLWNASVEEAEIINRAPRRLRIDVFNDMIHRARASKKQLRGGKITRTDSDVSLSESLYDSLFSDDDNKTDDANRSRNKTKNMKIDVSDVVTACLDNMAAKTGNIKIQRQSHMDRWLQKAKSKTPEKVKTEKNLTCPVITQKVETMVIPKVDNIPVVGELTPNKVENNTSTINSSRSKKKRLPPKEVKITKVYKLRRSYEAHNAHSLAQSESEILRIKDELNCTLEDESVAMDKSNNVDFSENFDTTNCNGVIPKSEPLENGNSHDSKNFNHKIELLNIETVTAKNTDEVLNAIDDLIEDKQIAIIHEETKSIYLNQKSAQIASISQEAYQDNEASKSIYPDEKSVKPDCITQESYKNDQPEVMEMDECMENGAVPDDSENKPNDEITTIVLNGSKEVMVKEEKQVNNFQVIIENLLGSPAKSDKDNQGYTLLPGRQDNSDETKRDNEVDKCLLKEEDDYSPDFAMKDKNVDIPVLSENKLTRPVEMELDCEVKIPMINVKSTREIETKNIDIVSVGTKNKIHTNESRTLSLEVPSKEKQIQESAQNESSDPHVVTDHSPRSLKSNEMVLIPEVDIANSDSNSKETECNAHEKTDVQDHNSNIKNSETMPKGIIESTNLTNNSLISDPNKNIYMSIDETLEDEYIKINDEGNFLNESGNSDSILQTYILDDDTSEEKDKTAKMNSDVSTISESILDTTPNEALKKVNNVEIKPVEATIVQRIELNPFLNDFNHVEPIDKPSIDNFFREVSMNKPPDLKSQNLSAKVELLKSVVENTNEFYEDDDLSDDEPSPEYEPLGDEITEDFRQHMKCIESIITDKKDEAQLVKVCNEIAVIQESRTKICDTIPIISDTDTSLILPIEGTENFTKEDIIISKQPHIETIPYINVKDTSLIMPTERTQNFTKEESTKPDQIPSEIESDQRNEIAELEQKSGETIKSKLTINGVVRKKTEHSTDLTIHISKEKKSVFINVEHESEDKNESNTADNLKSPLGKNKYRLSLKKNKSTTEDTATNEHTVLNERYKTIDQIEEIIQKNTEPKILPIQNGEINITILSKPVHSDTPDLPSGDDDFNIDDVSVNSEDSDISLSNTQQNMAKRNLRSRPEKKSGLENPDFLKYLELNQDSWMEQHPDLSPDDIVCYLYKIFLYQENLKSDDKISDEALPSNLVKGVKKDSLDARINKKTKKTSQPKNTIENLFREKYKNAKKIDLDIRSDSVNTSDSNEDSNQQRELRSVSPVDSGIGNSKDSNESTASTKRKTRSKSPAQWSLTPEITEEVKDELIDEVVKQETDKLSTSSPKTPKSRKTKPMSPRVLQKTGDKRIPVVVISPLKHVCDTKCELDPEIESVDSDSELPLRQLRTKVLQENNVDELKTEMLQQNVKEDKEMASASTDNEPIVKQKTQKVDKSLENTYQDPEFVKYLELRQDTIIDENPQLSLNEIKAYLYKSWLYENSSKSEIQKNEEIELTNLVKGINQESVPQRKVRRKLKTDKTDIQVVDDVIPKQKPKRKTVKHYFNEDFVSDIEDELEVFEIFKTEESPKSVVSKADNDKQSPKKETDSNDVKSEKPAKNEDEDVDEKVVEVMSTEDEIELYFKQLITPKPSVFKGLIREKVCEICEDISNLIKCKGCNGMFHYDCVVAKETESPKTVRLKKKRGRKFKTVRDSDNNEDRKTVRDENSDERCQDLSEENLSMEDECAKDTEPSKTKIKKRRGRKPKSLQDSENSDERSHDISEENVSVEDMTVCTFDAATLEAQLEAKMKELLENNQEFNYDSYSSDDGIEWTETLPGQCEIVDVKLKKRNPPIDYANFKCDNCKKYDTPVCFVCRSAVSKSGVKYRQKCNMPHCHNYYHLECLDHWPQTQFNAGELKGKKRQSEAFTCPRHVCHTCVCDDPRGCKTRFIGDKLAKCVRCPATYHAFNRCLPAGTQILTASLIICPRHCEHRPGKINCHVNTGWCFICALGGSLICCEYCPTSFHAECLNIKPPEGNYMCEDCETGRLPLYGEMVWVKLGQYRWWPGIILHPSEIPDNIMAVNHGFGEFVVRFFGQYDHYWVNRGRVFPYQEGDSGRLSGQKSKIDADFTIAMEHAQRAAKILKNAPPDEEEEAEIAASLLPPHYVKLKCNKPIGSLCGKKIEDPSLSLTQCECNPADIEPCGPNSQCLNRMLLTECGPTCRAGERCNNRAFEKRQYPKLTPYRASHRGWGLKTLEDIKAGQFVIEYVGELLDEDEFRRRMTRKHEMRDENFYFLTLDKERMIDAGPKGNLARFMNHCCEPNCETQKWTVLGDIRVGLFAIDDIPANSEVTFNYNLECTGIEKKRCLCGAKRCSGYIGAKPKQIDESQRKIKNGVAKRTYKKRKNLEESPATSKNKTKKPVGRPPKPKELTEIEKDLLLIKNASSDESRQSIDDKPRKKKIDPNPTEEASISNGTEPNKSLNKKLDPNSKEQSSTSKETDSTKMLKNKSDNINDLQILNGPESSRSKKKLDSNSKQEDSISNDVGTTNSKKKIDCQKEDVSKKREPTKLIQKKLFSNLKEEVPISNGPRTLKRKLDAKESSMTNGIESKTLKRKLDSNSKWEVSISIEPSSKKQKCGIEVGD